MRNAKQVLIWGLLLVTACGGSQATLTPEPTATSPPTPTPTRPPNTPTVVAPAPATPTPSPPPTEALPAGEWTVRSYDTDDAAVIFVNGQMVAASEYERDTDWINVNDYLLPGQDTVVAFASYNGQLGGRWGFGVQRDGVAVWEIEGTTDDDWSFSYAQQVAIHTDGSVEALSPDVAARTAPPGTWYVRAQEIKDVGCILVNGQPVAISRRSRQEEWVDVTALLYSDRDNTITFGVWNFEESFSWDLAIKHEDEILWAASEAGGDQRGVVFLQDVTITGAGQVRQ